MHKTIYYINLQNKKVAIYSAIFYNTMEKPNG